MKRPILLLLLLVIARIVSAQVIPDSIFRDWKPSTTGGVACVVYKGDVVFRKAFGLANVKRKIPNSPGLEFDLASNAKQFTAMCIALLEEQGKISKDDPLKKYYPDLKFKDDVRIHNLIDHTSGLRDASVLAVLSGKMNLKGEVRKKFNTKEYFIECLMRETDLGFPPGSEMSYNNFNYVLLADIVEKVSHQKFSFFLDSAILKPLGMTHTSLRNGVVGDHNMLSTVDDLVKWQMNFTDNSLGKKDQQLIAKVTSPSRLNDGATTRYAYGLFITQHKGVNVIWHGGDDGRQTSMILRFPDQDLSVIVLSNSFRYNLTERTAFELADVFLTGDLIQPATTKSSFGDHKFISVDPKDLGQWVGRYTRLTEHGLPQEVRIRLENNQLVETWGNQTPITPLSPVSPTQFFGKAPNNRILYIAFDKDATGLTYRFHTYDTMHFVKTPDAKNDRKDFVGRFKNESTGATFKVKQRRDNLIARKGILRIPMRDFARDQFYAYNNDALFTFVRNENGEVTSLRVDAPDFRNFWFMKE